MRKMTSAIFTKKSQAYPHLVDLDFLLQVETTKKKINFQQKAHPSTKKKTNYNSNCCVWKYPKHRPQYDIKGWVTSQTS